MIRDKWKPFRINCLMLHIFLAEISDMMLIVWSIMGIPAITGLLPNSLTRELLFFRADELITKAANVPAYQI